MAEDFNADFYVTCATVIPVLLLAVAVQDAFNRFVSGTWTLALEAKRSAREEEDANYRMRYLELPGAPKESPSEPDQAPLARQARRPPARPPVGRRFRAVMRATAVLLACAALTIMAAGSLGESSHCLPCTGTQKRCPASGRSFSRRR
jgi:hypothetical protein